MKRTLILAILLLIPLASSGAQAQSTLIGVELECDMQTIEINVHPQQNDPVAVSCSVTNTGAFKETISLDSDVDANDFSLVLSEDNFELEAGEDASFSATFSAQPRMEVTEADFNIVAQIDSFGPEPIAVPIGMLNSTDNVAGVVKSLPYSLIDLEVSDTSTRNVESGEEITISFTIFNDGNRVDELELMTINQEELEDADFMFVSDSFVRFATVNPSSSSDQGSIVIKAPDNLEEEKTYKIELRAYSKLDSSAEVDEIEITIVVGSTSGGTGSIGLDLESLGDESVSTIAMGIGGLIGLILLLVLISKMTKKTGTQKIAAKEARKAAKAARRTSKKSKVIEVEHEEEYEEEEDFDFEDFDDDDFDFDDL